MGIPSLIHVIGACTRTSLSAPRGNLVASNVCQQGTVNGGSEQPKNKAGKGDTTAVTTWAEKLLHGLSSYYMGQPK